MKIMIQVELNSVEDFLKIRYQEEQLDRTEESWIKLLIKVQECAPQTILNKMFKKPEMVYNYSKVEWMG